MADLSKYSDDDLERLARNQKLASMSDADLQKLAGKPAVTVGEDMAKSVAPGLSDIAAGFGLPNTVHDWMQRKLVGAGNAILGTHMGDPTDPKAQAEASQKVFGTNIVPKDNSPTTAEGLTADLNKKFPSTAYQPQTFPGEATRMGVSFAPGLFGGGGSMLNKAATRVIAPALGATGLSSGFDPVTEPGMHAAGAVLGALLGHGVGGGTARAYQALRADPNPVTTAENYLRQHAESSGVTPETIIANQIPGRGQLGGEAMGQSGQDLLATIGRRSGTTPQALVNALTLRTSQAPNRMMEDFATAAGIHPAAAKLDIDALVQAGRDSVAPGFTKVLGAPGGVMNPDLEALMKRPVIKTAMAQAANDIRNDGGDPTAVGLHFDEDGKVTQVSHPTAEAWDKTKKAMNKQVARDPFGKVLSNSAAPGNVNISNANRDLTTVLRDAIPGYGELLDKSGDYLGLQKASELGQAHILDTRTTAAQVAKHVEGLTPPELAAYKGGMAHEIFLKAQNARLAPRLLNTQAVEGKLTAALGADAASTLMKNVRDEIELGSTGSRIYPRGGSISSNILLEAGQQDHAANLGAVLEGARGAAQLGAGHVGGVIPIMKSVAHFAPDMWKTGGMNADVRNHLGSLLQLPPEDLAATLRRIQQPATNSQASWLARALQKP